MGVEVDRRKYEKALRPVQKLRAGVFTVIATIRLRKMEEQWRGVRETSAELGKLRAKHIKQGGVRRREG